jgi:hypothetical protein
LQWEDVDFAANRLHVRHALGQDGTLGPPKGGKTATIELTPAARAALLELRQKSSSDFVFTNAVGGSRQPRDVQRAFTKARERAALPSTEDGRSSSTRYATPASRGSQTMPRFRSFTSATSLAIPTWRRRRDTFTRSSRRWLRSPSRRRSQVKGDRTNEKDTGTRRPRGGYGAKRSRRPRMQVAGAARRASSTHAQGRRSAFSTRTSPASLRRGRSQAVRSVVRSPTSTGGTSSIR